jgi:hypothetical protein
MAITASTPSGRLPRMTKASHMFCNRSRGNRPLDTAQAPNKELHEVHIS